MTREPALITGASAGIGAALAREFAARGHELLLVARSADALAALAAELEQRHSVRCHTIAVDLLRANAAQTIYRYARRHRLEIGVLVNNAGMLVEGAFAEAPLEAHGDLLQLNIVAVTALTHLFIQPMLRRKRGRVLNIASMSAFSPAPSLATYAASKAYLLSFSEALSIETRGTGVTVTAVCPGFTDTGMIARADGPAMRLPLIPNMTPRRVAREAYAACIAGRPVLVNGALNRLTIESLRHAPLWLRRELIAVVERRGF
jgi:uncharacterized protein